MVSGVGAPPTRFFVDVAALPTGFGGLVQVMTLTAMYAVCMYAATKHGMLAGLRRSLLFRHAKVVYHVALPLASVFPALAMVAMSSAGLATTDGLDIGMGLLSGSTVASLSLFWFATVLCGRVTLGDGDGLPRYASAAKLVPPGSLDLTGTGVAVSPRAQLGAQVRTQREKERHTATEEQHLSQRLPHCCVCVADDAPHGVHVRRRPPAHARRRRRPVRAGRRRGPPLLAPGAGRVRRPAGGVPVAVARRRRRGGMSGRRGQGDFPPISLQALSPCSLPHVSPASLPRTGRRRCWRTCTRRRS